MLRQKEISKGFIVGNSGESRELESAERAFKLLGRVREERLVE